MKGKHIVLIVILSIAPLFIFTGTFPAQARECVNSKCHSGMGKAKVVHGPVMAGQCVVCHTNGNPDHPTASVKDDFKLRAQGKKLCYLCHEPKDGQKVVHRPVLDGECTYCHDPHQSDFEKRLTAATTSDLCFSCHINDKTNKKVVHEPVASGDCNICHNPHSAPFKGLVELKGSELCFLCHEDRRDQFELKYRHKPVTEGCNGCHDAHATDFPYLLYSEEETLCLGCHKNMAKHLKESSVKHSALDKKKCTVCHTAHASDYPWQLKASTRKICYECHQDLGAQINNSKYLHGPVAQDDCYACHDSHGSDYTKILKKPFPDEFYQPYATEYYALCFDCHNSNIALEKFTTTLTGFRNGNLNLHFLHVNREKGRSCKACHEMHAGNQPKLIRREVPFGGSGWMLPIIFTQHRNGGRCVVGCHKPRDYDRMNPVEY